MAGPCADAIAHAVNDSCAPQGGQPRSPKGLENRARRPENSGYLLLFYV
jgi:hypothetical protein